MFLKNPSLQTQDDKREEPEGEKLLLGQAFKMPLKQNVLLGHKTQRLFNIWYPGRQKQSETLEEPVSLVKFSGQALLVLRFPPGHQFPAVQIGQGLVPVTEPSPK